MGVGSVFLSVVVDSGLQADDTPPPYPPPQKKTQTNRHTDPQPINDFSAGGEAMGDLSFVGHLVSIFLSFAIVAYLYCVLGALFFFVLLLALPCPAWIVD